MRFRKRARGEMPPVGYVNDPRFRGRKARTSVARIAKGALVVVAVAIGSPTTARAQGTRPSRPRSIVIPARATRDTTTKRDSRWRRDPPTLPGPARAGTHLCQWAGPDSRLV